MVRVKLKKQHRRCMASREESAGIAEGGRVGAGGGAEAEGSTGGEGWIEEECGGVGGEGWAGDEGSDTGGEGWAEEVAGPRNLTAQGANAGSRKLTAQGERARSGRLTVPVAKAGPRKLKVSIYQGGKWRPEWVEDVAMLAGGNDDAGGRGGRGLRVGGEG